MRMQRVEFSIRQFLSLLLFLPATDGKVRLQAFHFFSALNQLITWTAAPVWTILPLSAVQQGPPSDTSVPTLPALGGERGGAFLNERWDWRVVPRRLLRRGNVQRVLGGGRGGRQRVSRWTRAEEAPARRRMVMPASGAPVVLLMCRLLVIQAQPCPSST